MKNSKLTPNGTPGLFKDFEKFLENLDTIEQKRIFHISHVRHSIVHSIVHPISDCVLIAPSSWGSIRMINTGLLNEFEIIGWMGGYHWMVCFKVNCVRHWKGWTSGMNKQMNKKDDEKDENVGVEPMMGADDSRLVRVLPFFSHWTCSAGRPECSSLVTPYKHHLECFKTIANLAILWGCLWWRDCLSKKGFQIFLSVAGQQA